MNIFNTRASHYGDNLPTPSLANTHQNEYEMGYSAQGMTEGVNNFLEFVDETKKYRIEWYGTLSFHISFFPEYQVFSS